MCHNFYIDLFRRPLFNIPMEKKLKNMTTMEIAEYSFRQGYSNLARKLVSGIRRSYSHISEAEMEELVAEIKKDENRVCDIFLAYMRLKEELDR